MTKLLLLSLLFLPVNVISQVNCGALFEKGLPCYEACVMVYEQEGGVKNMPQGSYASINGLDSAIAICPGFADLYYMRAIPYLKRGEFITWKKIIDKAVENDSILYLGYRGGARFMFLRDYEGAIKDIEDLKQMGNWDIGTIYNGEYHLEVIRALSYRGIGDTLKAVSILQKHIDSYTIIGNYDYFHLGVMLYQLKKYDEAEKAFKRQIAIRNYYADTYYYLALVNEEQGNFPEYYSNLKRAFGFYKEGKCVRGLDSFMDYPDKVYLKQIEDRLFVISNQGL